MGAEQKIEGGVDFLRDRCMVMKRKKDTMKGVGKKIESGR